MTKTSHDAVDNNKENIELDLPLIEDSNDFDVTNLLLIAWDFDFKNFDKIM